MSTNIFDYLAWRGDLSFQECRINEVDSLILSCLSYIRFPGIVPGISESGSVTIKEASNAFFSQDRENRRTRTKEDERLLRMLGESRRFGPLRLSRYADRLSREQEKQFAAVTVLFEDHSAFFVFRGTDSTLVGWKEDFNMAFMPVIPAQKEALEYLIRGAEQTGGPLLCGGHSKGGNLAVFATSACPKAMQRRIQTVYNHDGPGFEKEMLKSEGYLSVSDRIHTFLPQSSIVGMLLDHEDDYTVIHSTQTGLLQHDPYSWEVMGPEFIRVKSVSTSSEFIDRTLKNWLSGLSSSERKDFFNSLYQIFSATDAETLQDLPVCWIKNFRKVSKSLLDISPENRRMLHRTFFRLLDAGKEALLKDH